VIDASCGIDGLIINTGHFFGNLAGAFSGKLVANLAMALAPDCSVQALGRSRLVQTAASRHPT
jgi:glycine/D-amino acid oxidase-like deaminating enzyme